MNQYNITISSFNKPKVTCAAPPNLSGVPIEEYLAKKANDTSLKLIINLPVYGNIDISKVHPRLIGHILNGGTVTGIPKNTMNDIVKQIMLRVYAATAQAQNKPIEPEIARTLPNEELKQYLRPLSELPEDSIGNEMQGKLLPYLTSDQTDVVKVNLLIKALDLKRL
jgi:hypothetical protein